ncbi:MAG TPA: hypothetical protein VJA21_11055 [Verrucomicrobiae bacterium]
MPNDTLASHPLVKLALENLRPLLEEAGEGLLQLAKQGEVRSEGDATVLEYEFYDDDVFRNAGAAVDALERLEQGQRLIEAATKSPWSWAGFDRHTWIEYHYSCYVVTFVSLADIALVLTNSVFRLGNRERDCKPDLIARNWWVAPTPAKAALEELATLIRPYREGRNLHVHRGKLQAIAEVMGSKLLDQLKLLSFVERVGKPVVASDVLEKGYSIEIPKISARLDRERTDVTARILAVFDALYPVYKQKSEELHEKWRPVIEKKAEVARALRSGPARPEG